MDIVNIFDVFIFFAVTVFSFILFRKAAGDMSLSRLNMISWMFYIYFYLQFMPSALIVKLGLDSHYIISHSNISYDVKTFTVYCIYYVALIMPLSMFFTTKLLKVDRMNILYNNYLSNDIQPVVLNKDILFKFGLRLCSLICLLVSIDIILKSSFSLSDLVKGSLDDVREIRVSNGRGFEGNVYLKNLFGSNLSIVLSYVAYSYYLKYKNKIDLLWFLSLSVSSVLVMIVGLAKSPIIFYLLGFVFIRISVFGYLSKKMIYFFAAFSFVFIVFTYIFVAKVVDPSVLFSLSSGIGGRILFTQSAGLYLMFEYFPDRIDYLMFDSVSDVLSSLSGNDNLPRAARLIMIERFGTRADLSGVMNSLFVGEAWANFGYVGLVLSPIWVGFVIQTLYILLLKSRKTPLTIALYAYFSVQSTISGGFNDYFYKPGVFMLLSIVFFCYFVNRMLNGKG